MTRELSMTTAAAAAVALSMAQQRRHEVFWTRVFFFSASCVAGLIIARKRKLHRFHQHILSAAKANDFGRYFGMDIGGTLAKMVYFQPLGGEISKHLHKPQHEEGCLSHIEEYILALHSADHTRSAQREERLELHVPELGGTIHFCKYALCCVICFCYWFSLWANYCMAVQLPDFENGGDHRLCAPSVLSPIHQEDLVHGRRRVQGKSTTVQVTYTCNQSPVLMLSSMVNNAQFSRLFNEKLGIEIHKADEMDALINGLNFVLQYAKDECYTFKVRFCDR